MIWWLLLAGLGALFVVVWRHKPTRRMMLRSLDPTWHQRSASQQNDPQEMARETARIYVSSAVMRSGCDVIWDAFNDHPPTGFTGPHPDGTVVWVDTTHLPRFVAEYLPRMEGKFVLVTASDTDTTTGFDHETLLASPKVLHWFVGNAELPAEVLDTGKITLLPLGLNYRIRDPQDPNQNRDKGAPASIAQQQAAINQIRRTIEPIRERPLKVYADFHLDLDSDLRTPDALDRPDARTSARDTLKDKAFMLWETNRAQRDTVWKRHQDAAFVAVPNGNPVDCHRTHEALILRSIPIVKSSQLDPLYDRLPVAIIKDWSEVTEAQLASWLEEFAPWFDQPLPPEMFSDHWIDRFHGFKTRPSPKPGQ